MPHLRLPSLRRFVTTANTGPIRHREAIRKKGYGPVPTFEQFLVEEGELLDDGDVIDDDDAVDSAPCPLPVCAAIARSFRNARGARPRERREREIEVDIEVIAELAIEIVADEAVPPSLRAA